MSPNSNRKAWLKPEMTQVTLLCQNTARTSNVALLSTYVCAQVGQCVAEKICLSLYDSEVNSVGHFYGFYLRFQVLFLICVKSLQYGLGHFPLFKLKQCKRELVGPKRGRRRDVAV